MKVQEENKLRNMAALGSFLVLSICILGLFHVETSPDSLSSKDSSFCHGGLEVIYPELDIDKCLIVPKDQKLREKVSKVWKAPQIYFSGAHKGDALQSGQTHGTTLTDYHPPTPPQKSGFHRYQLMLFEQPPEASVSLSPPENSSRGKWDLQAFVTRFNLGEPVAALQFLTQNCKD
ncbi:phosphatidylethanolamine-binding protein 4 isoform X2 [Pleuronectes platessa]|uniref:phosphatidylethanolamine-binding protein 4 isoform X2 n=1 Tax=Pleuronectes platessa TaxID=8262 RepID=UPI00232A6277|nr:phosphatidylethanolamine-binding protein 4 isoform X2 [Pleuronectes platessa]